LTDRSPLPVVIIGAGPAGLTAGHELLKRTGLKPLIFEADRQVGGISKTVEYRGNRMDLGGHRFFSKSDWVMDWWQQIMPVEAPDPSRPDAAVGIAYQNARREFVPATGTGDAVLLVRQRLSRILYRRKFYDYPLKLSARTLLNLGSVRTAKIGASYALARVHPRSPEVTLEDFLINRFGGELYRTFFRSYTEKVWGVPCDQISAEWGAQRIKSLSVLRALAHAARGLLPRRASLAQRDVETSLIEQFLYPRLGPGQMWEIVADRIVERGGEVHLGHEVVDVERAGARVVAVHVLDRAAGERRRIECQALLSTMPVGDLVQHLRPDDTRLIGIARDLPHRDFMTAGLLLRRRGPVPADNWIYVQEEDVRLGRIQIFNNWSPALVRDPDTVWLGLEYFCNMGDDLWSLDDGAFLEFAAKELAQIGFARREDVLDGTVVRVPKAYPAYFGSYGELDRVRHWLDGIENLYPIGRNGMHRYNNQDHSMLAANAAVECLATGRRDMAALWAINTEEEYHEAKRRLTRLSR
jgi:protoporphyrinogen oxidase